MRRHDLDWVSLIAGVVFLAAHSIYMLLSAHTKRESSEVDALEAKMKGLPEKIQRHSLAVAALVARLILVSPVVWYDLRGIVRLWQRFAFSPALLPLTTFVAPPMYVNLMAMLAFSFLGAALSSVVLAQAGQDVAVVQRQQQRGRAPGAVRRPEQRRHGDQARDLHQRHRPHGRNQIGRAHV